VQQELYKYVQPAGEDERAAEDIQRTAGDVAHERDDRGDEQRNRPGDGEGEGQEPVPAGGKVDIEQVQSHRDEIDRHKYDGIGPPEPHGQQDNDIQQRNRSRRIAGPDKRSVDAPVAQQTQKCGQKRRDGQHEQDAGTVHVLGPDAFVRRKWRLGKIARDIRMEHRRPAQRTFFLAVGEFNAAFDTIHVSQPPIHAQRWLLSTLTGSPSVCSTR
jgi:hypothetical protein